MTPDARPPAKARPIDRFARFVKPVSDPFLALLKRVFGIDVSFFAKNAFIVTVSYGISIARGFVAGYLVARLFPREMYGQYQFILSSVGMIGVFGLPGVINSLGRAVARGEKGVIVPVARFQFLIALITSAGIVSMTFFLPENRQELWPLFLLAAALFPVSQVASTIFTGITVGKSRFDVSLRANLTWSTLMVIAALGILFGYPSTALLYAAAVGLPAITYLAYSIRFLGRVTPEPSVRHIIRYGVQLTLVSLPLSLSWYVDKLMISGMMGLNQLAVFSVGILIPEQFKSLAKELLPVSFAVQARGDDSLARRRRLLFATGRATLIFSVGIAAYIVLCPWIFALLFPNYPEAVFLSQLSALTLITFPGALLTQYLEAQAMLPELRKTQWISAGVFIVSLLTLIPAFGLAGAVLARGVLRLSTTVCGVYFLSRKP